MNSDEQRPATDAEVKAVKQFFDAMIGGLCPECGQPVVEEEQRARCVYALPCGHRIWQGKARKKEVIHA